MTAFPNSLLNKKIAGLSQVSDSDLDLLFATASQKHYAKGELLLKQGQICKTIFFVEKGYLRTFLDKDGTEVNTAFTFEDHFTTDLKSLRSGSVAESSIIAGETATVYEFDKDKLLALYKTSAEIESFGRKLLEQLLITQEEHTNLFRIYSPAERYRYLEKNNPGILQRVSLSQLASYLGIARETLSRIRKNKM